MIDVSLRLRIQMDYSSVCMDEFFFALRKILKFLLRERFKVILDNHFVHLKISSGVYALSHQIAFTYSYITHNIFPLNPVNLRIFRTNSSLPFVYGSRLPACASNKFSFHLHAFQAVLLFYLWQKPGLPLSNQQSGVFLN